MPTMATDYDGHYPSQEEISRNKIMDGCIRAIDKYGIDKVNIRLIVEESGVARQTVYNHYKNKQAIILDTFSREGLRISTACAEEIKKYSAVDDKFVKGFLFMYQALPQNPILRLIIDRHQDFKTIVGFDGYSFSVFGDWCFGEIFTQHPELQAEQREMSELWSRSVLSLLLLPPEETTIEALEGYVRRRLLPGLGLKE